MKYVRVFVAPTVDNPGVAPFYIDAIIDDGGEILGLHSLLGVLGRFDRKDECFEPFVLDFRGEVDWGDGFDKSNDRYGRLDLRDGPVMIGRELRLGSDVYRIKNVQQLPA